MHYLVLATLALLPKTLALVTPPQIPWSGNGNRLSSMLLDDSSTFAPEALRLVKLAEHEPPIWISEWDKVQFKAAGMNFMDITDTADLGILPGVPGFQSDFHHPNATKAVNKGISLLSIDDMEDNLSKLTSFRTRHYRSATGQQSQKWLLSRISELTEEFANPSLRSKISISEFEHSWGQHTIVVRVNGISKIDEIVILGAHQDSTNLFSFLPAPGADDDGSGSVTILEAYRALLASDFVPQRSVEFHWYSAEEAGLLGSQALVKHYQNRNASVYAMMQMDMTAWVKTGTTEEVGLVTDFTDTSLTEFIKRLVNEYLSIPYTETKCGYACSDHASWTRAGYRSAFSIESAFENTNPHIHSMNDRLDISSEFSFTHMLEFSKLAVAFAIELSAS